MSITQKSRRVVSIAVPVLLVSCFALLLATDKRAATTSAQASEDRKLEDKVPRHLPFSVKLKTEKEKSFKDQQNVKWVRDLELEIKNTGDKPIYFIQFALVPDFGKAPTERTLALTIQYGRDKLVGFETATAEDVPIRPGEKVCLKVRDMEIEGWDHFKEVEHWPEEWSKPKRVSLEFVELNFGDGTGFEGGDGTPREGRKPKHASIE